MKTRFKDVYKRYRSKGIGCAEAASLLGVSERTFLRKRQRFEQEGEEGLLDRRVGRRSSRRAGDDEVEFLTALYNQRFEGFSIRHFYAYNRSQLKRSYNWCRTALIAAGVVRKGTRGGKHRLRRERKPMEGMMLHQDASTHRWLEGLGYNVDLVVTLDDATSTITSAFLCAQEGTLSSLIGIKETIEKYGLFCSLYTDRGSHYAYTPEAGGKVDKKQLTQVGQVLKQLNIKHIHAYSPQARGRSERLFGTLQGRLPKELAMAGITTLEEANRYLREVYIPAHNQEFSVRASIPQSAYLPWLSHRSLDEVICLKEQRTVQHDNTISYLGKTLQIPASAHRHHYVKVEVEVRQYIDGTLGVFHGHLCLGRYNQAGVLIEQQTITQPLQCA